MLAAEEARRALEAQFAQLQQEAAHDRAAADERFVGLLDRVTQRQDAQIQQMQQGHICHVQYGSATSLSHRVSPTSAGRPSGHECFSPCFDSDSSFSSSFGAKHCVIPSWDLLLSSLLTSTIGVALLVTC
jgi:hypothetical protein